jgi:hypothetical protein
VDANMLRFERGKEFWTFTAEQQVELEWHVFKDYQKALKAQNALLSFKENNAEYLINRMLLLRLMGADSLATLAENDLQNRYNTNGLPLDYYKKGSFKVGEYERPNGIIEDYRYFRPNLYEDVKYARYYLSEGGQILGIHKAGLTERSKDSVPRFWNFERDQFYQMPATDTSYSGFKALFELPDSTLVSKVRFETGKLEVEELMPVQDTTSSLEER